ncbi:MAG: DUF3822 family protein [Bacteroidales bacterium]|nr:DUF3822 family protein [Bacteroidales bacterium]
MTQLTKDMAPVPQMWRMAMAVRPLLVEVVLNPLLEDATLVHETIELDKSMAQLAAFEDMIYENPLLLSDFDRTSVLIDTTKFTIVPREITNEELREKIMLALYPDPKLTVVAQEIEGTDDTLLMAVDSGLLAFLQRTFLDGKIMHPIAVMAGYFSNRARQGNADRVYARVRPGWVDVVATEGQMLRIANSFVAPTADDAAYYIMAATQTSEYNLLDTEIMIFGDTSLRDDVMARLRPFAPKVMPLIFPSELYRAGADVSTPLELLVV